jgi:hypothetical protein
MKQSTKSRKSTGNGSGRWTPELFAQHQIIADADSLRIAPAIPSLAAGTYAYRPLQVNVFQ